MQRLDAATAGDTSMAETRRDELWTIHDVARYLRIHEKTAYDWAAQGRLPCIRLGGRLRFDPVELGRWVDSQKAGL